MGPEEVVPVAVEGRPWGVVSLREEREEKGGIPEVKVLELGKGQQGGCLFFFWFLLFSIPPILRNQKKRQETDNDDIHPQHPQLGMIQVKRILQRQPPLPIAKHGPGVFHNINAARWPPCSDVARDALQQQRPVPGEPYQERRLLFRLPSRRFGDMLQQQLPRRSRVFRQQRERIRYGW